jgi:ribonuclease HI
VSQMIQNQGNTLTLRWVPGHTEIEGNEMADIRAKAAAQSEWVGRNDDPVATISLAHLQRTTIERIARETK